MRFWDSLEALPNYIYCICTKQTKLGIGECQCMTHCSLLAPFVAAFDLSLKWMIYRSIFKFKGVLSIRIFEPFDTTLRI